MLADEVRRVGEPSGIFRPVRDAMRARGSRSGSDRWRCLCIRFNVPKLWQRTRERYGHEVRLPQGNFSFRSRELRTCMCLSIACGKPIPQGSRRSPRGHGGRATFFPSYGELYVADNGTHIDKFTSSGAYIEQFSVPARFMDFFSVSRGRRKATYTGSEMRVWKVGESTAPPERRSTAVGGRETYLPGGGTRYGRRGSRPTVISS